MKSSMRSIQLLALCFALSLSVEVVLTATSSDKGRPGDARGSAIASVPQSGGDTSCAITTPNENVAAAPEPAGWNHGNEALVTWLPPDGNVVFRPGGPGFVLEDGALSMKFGWWRVRRGQLAIAGRRLDGTAPEMRARIPDGYGEVGFQATALIFPTAGCWAVTARLDKTILNFVVRVEKIGPGPGRSAAR